MKLLEHSIGMAPFWIIQGMVLVSLITMSVYYRKIHQFGPSVAIAGIKNDTEMRPQENSADYAKAIVFRFNHEFWNWGYNGHLVAKQRAAYFCSVDVGTVCIKNATGVNAYYREMLMTRNGTIISQKVEWENAHSTEYVISAIIKVKIWQAHKVSDRYYRGTFEVSPVSHSLDRPFTLNIKNYNFKEYTPSTEKQGLSQ